MKIYNVIVTNVYGNVHVTSFRDDEVRARQDFAAAIDEENLHEDTRCVTLACQEITDDGVTWTHLEEHEISF
jgi:hypothetical protein